MEQSANANKSGSRSRSGSSSSSSSSSSRITANKQKTRVRQRLHRTLTTEERSWARAGSSATVRNSMCSLGVLAAMNPRMLDSYVFALF